ncbi:MAG: hypothetical protein LC104_09840 [Bacteroidales bacterium]|nr:hypothetical protein [Bacteroidales bacterium]
MYWFRTISVGWLAAFLFVMGCGPGEKETGLLSGKVTLHDAPVQSGALNLISKSGAAALTNINADGTFKIEAPLEVGDYTAYLSPPTPEPHAPGTKAPALKKFEVPAKFLAPTTSGATVTVKTGENSVTIKFE